MQKHTAKNDIVPVEKMRLGMQHSKPSSANIKNKDKNLNENDNTVLLMLNSQELHKYYNKHCAFLE